MEKLRNLRRKYFSPEMSMKALFAFCIIYAIVAGVALFKISNANASDEDNNMEGVLDFKTASEDFFNEYYQKTPNE